MTAAKTKKAGAAKKVSGVGTSASARRSNRKKAVTYNVTNVDNDSSQGRAQDVDSEGSSGVNGMSSGINLNSTITDPPISEPCHRRYIAGYPGPSGGRRRPPERGK
jgi:hypothetical protein